MDKPRPLNDLWRVDIRGIPCQVKGEYAKIMIENMIRENTRFKLALYKIKKEVLETLGH